MKTRVTVLGAGFAGLELSTRLSEEFDHEVEVTLIDKNDHFVFGYSKLDVMFGRVPLEAVKLPYANYAHPGVRFVRDTVTQVDPQKHRVVTTQGTYDADFLVAALGADYDMAATPGLAEGGNEFYSVAGANRLRQVLPTFQGGQVVVGVAAAPFKCPPAPSECALMMHDYLLKRGLREVSQITLVIPLPAPVPPSPDTSAALLEEFAARNITFMPKRAVASVNGPGRSITLDDGTELPCDLLLGVPRHCAPQVLVDSGMTENGWVKVDPRTLETQWPGVFACGDVAATGVPKAGVFAEGAARAVAETIAATIRGESHKGLNPGAGQCYIEFGEDRIARVNVDFLSGPKPTGSYQAASLQLRHDKEQFGSSRRARWFGL